MSVARVIAASMVFMTPPNMSIFALAFATGLRKCKIRDLDTSLGLTDAIVFEVVALEPMGANDEKITVKIRDFALSAPYSSHNFRCIPTVDIHRL